MLNPFIFTKVVALRTKLLLSASILAFAYFSSAPRSHGGLPPPAPDGGYPGGNTAEGNGALLSLTTGVDNVAVG